MKMSKLALTTSKSRIDSDECLSSRILLQSGLICRYGSGIYGQHNFLVKVQEKIKNIIRNSLDSYDCIEVSLPILQPKQIWVASGRWNQYVDSDQMFITNTKNGTYCFAPTAEEAIFKFVENNLKSYKNLPVTLYQIGPKFRNEIRVRGGLLRSKEFSMMDAYSFHSSESSMKKEYARIREAYYSIFSELGLNVIPVAAINGEMGGKLSEEFMFISDAGEDTILVDDTNQIGLNTEILTLSNSAEYLKSNYNITNLSDLNKKHCIELGHIFQLGQYYSSNMNYTFKDSNNDNKPYFMGCYGIGVSRTLAAVCEQNCDEHGLIWPKNLAPYMISIVYQNNKTTEAFSLYDTLQNHNIDVLIDDRDISLCSKIKDSKLLGIPYLVIIGKNAKVGLYEVEERATGQKSYFSIDDLVKVVN